VRFLASQYEIGAAVSPRSFLIGRSLGASAAASPYLGLGNHAVPTVSALTELTSRGVFRQCAARAGEVRTAFANLRPVGATELATAQRAMGAGARVIEGGAFTDTAVAAEGAERGDLNKYAVLHFATHGLKEGELGCDSPPALVTSMGDKADSDGLLSFEEIAALRLDANLVVLSACNTAAGTTQARTDRSGFRSELGQAATLNGLARAFMVAGGRSVLTTHWAIPDSLKTRDGRTLAPSTQLIGTMFEAGASMPVAQALKRAQSSLIATPETSHPYFWGAFMLVGDGTRNMLARSS
jgi:CHAT domain-containing protein